MASSSSNSSYSTPSSVNTTNNPSSSSSSNSTNKHNTNNVAAHTKASKLQIAAIQKAFCDLLQDPQNVDEAAHYIYESLLDDAVVGVFLEIHHLRKTGNLTALDGKPEDDSATSSKRIVDLPNYDIFGMSTAKKPMECICPNCDRPVAASRFAIHLQKCMGMGRNSSRIATRRLATTKDGTSASSSSSSASNLQITASTDDEDDMEWASEKRRKKSNQNNRNNGSKKNNGK